MALSLHDADDEGSGVPVVDVSAVGEPVGGICVDTVKACLVGGRVEVTMRGGAGVAVSCAFVETFRQEVNIKVRIRKGNIFLDIRVKTSSSVIWIFQADR